VVVIVCGSREWTDKAPILRVLSGLEEHSIVIHGAQRGADVLAGEAAKELGLHVLPEEADWSAYGKAAGPMRNDKMLETLVKAATTYNQTVHCYAFHSDSKLGRGTRDMVRKCMQARVRCSAYVVPVPQMVRSSGDFVCKACKLPYRKHPSLISDLSYDGTPFLELSCDGLALKL
jgi:hypothetical protein